MQTDKNVLLVLARRVCTVQYFPADIRGLQIDVISSMSMWKGQSVRNTSNKVAWLLKLSGAKTSLGITQLVRGIF